MANVKILAGDFSKIGAGSFMFGSIQLTPKDAKWGSPKSYSVKTDVKTLNEADEQSSVSIFGAAGWGLVGAAIAGPLGALAGGILGGRRNDVVFVAEFTDGKKLLGKISKKAWIKMMAARF